jgi:hypothetical protein
VKMSWNFNIHIKVLFLFFEHTKLFFWFELVRLTFAFTFLKEWGGQQKKANRSSEKNKKKFGVASDKRVTNAISPESSPGVGRRRTKIPHTFPHSRYMTQMSVPEQAELEKLKQRINFSDLDQVRELLSK